MRAPRDVHAVQSNHQDELSRGKSTLGLGHRSSFRKRRRCGVMFRGEVGKDKGSRSGRPLMPLLGKHSIMSNNNT